MIPFIYSIASWGTGGRVPQHYNEKPPQSPRPFWHGMHAQTVRRFGCIGSRLADGRSLDPVSLGFPQLACCLVAPVPVEIFIDAAPERAAVTSGEQSRRDNGKQVANHGTPPVHGGGTVSLRGHSQARVRR